MNKRDGNGQWVSDKEYWEDGTELAGWKFVPIMPTEEMITAGLIPTAAWQDIKGSALTVNREKMRLRYEAMIAAAPQPSRESVTEQLPRGTPAPESSR